MMFYDNDQAVCFLCCFIRLRGSQYPGREIDRYTGSNGMIAGIALDLDVMRRTREDLAFYQMFVLA